MVAGFRWPHNHNHQPETARAGGSDMANINGTNATDILGGTGNADTINGLGGSDRLLGLNGNDRLVGGDGHDTLEGGNGNDRLIGGAGEDDFVGGRGKDTLDGTDTADEIAAGTGFDYVSYLFEGGGSGVTVNLRTGTATDTFGNKDTLIDIEAVRGTNFADRLIGGNSDNDGMEDFRPFAGADTINGGSGFDRVSYHADYRYGGEMGIVANLATGTIRDPFGDIDTVTSVEAVRGTRVDDEMIGNGGNNRFDPLAGNDFIDGRGGIDLVNYANDHFLQTAGVFTGVGIQADLAAGQIIDTSGLGIDTVVRVENVRGSAFDDEIRGDNGANVLQGMDGDDFLSGRGGNDSLAGGNGHDILRGNGGSDVIEGGAGDDTMNGGPGVDVFVFRPGADHDVIRGFADGQDILDLTAYGFASFNAVLNAASQQ